MTEHTKVEGLLEAARRLHEGINNQRQAGNIGDAPAQYMLSLSGNIRRTLKYLADNSTGVALPETKTMPVGDLWNGDLRGYVDFPTDRFPCPKCGDTKPAKRSYSIESKEAPEHVRHSCYCGYSIFTKPLDQSKETGEED
jgi:hypothetical protein